MKIFYYCYGSAHSSVLTAAIHTGILSSKELPTNDEILALPHYDKTEDPQIGIPFFFGKDEMDNEIYIIGMKSDKETILHAIKNFFQNAGVPATKYIFVDTLTNVNLITRIGGFLSRKLKLISLGRPMTIYGLKQVYFEFVHLVERTKKEITTFQ